MNRWIGILVVLAGLQAFGKQPMPNILLITADDMGTTTGCYGDKLAITPNLDRLAAEGVLFENGYVTHSSCSSSRSSILTGLYPHQNGHIGLAGHHPEYALKAGIATLPAVLKTAGYYNGILGKQHVSPGPNAIPFDFEWARHGNPTITRDVRLLADKAKEFLKGTEDRPFFLYVNYFDPHRPFDAMANQCKGLPENPYGPDDVTPFAYLGMDGEPVRREVAAYYNCVRRMDVGLGMLFDELRAAGQFENTVIIFLGDHGVPFIRAKTTCYEAGEEVPFIVKWPDVSKAGLKCDDLISSIDIMPTILDAVGVQSPSVAGCSLRDVLQGDTPKDWRKMLFAEYTSHTKELLYPRRSVRDGRFKLIQNLDYTRPNPITQIGATGPTFLTEDQMKSAYETNAHPPEWELYDLSKDPYETVNVAESPEYAEVFKTLQSGLRKWRTETNDPLLDPEELKRLKKVHGL